MDLARSYVQRNGNQDVSIPYANPSHPNRVYSQLNDKPKQVQGISQHPFLDRGAKSKEFPNIPNIAYGSRGRIMDHVLDDINIVGIWTSVNDLA